MTEVVARRRRRWTLVGLVVLLAAWIWLQFRYSDQARALYARQALTVHALTVRGEPTGVLWPDGSDAMSETATPWLSALEPRMPMLSSCLMTDAGSRAPVVLRLSTDAPASATLTDLDGAALDEALTSCVVEALEPAQWPDDATGARVELVLADLRLTTHRDMALRQVARLSTGR